MNSEKVYYRADPFNFLVTVLIGISAVVFILAYSSSFEASGVDIYVLSGIVAFVYFILVFVLFKFKKQKIIVPISERIIEREVKQPPVIKEVFRNIEKPVEREVIREVEKPVLKKVPVVIKNKIKKSKYVGSKYNERYHLRKCRFAGVIKKKYLMEEDERKYFKLRGYEPCKVCKPDKN